MNNKTIINLILAILIVIGVYIIFRAIVFPVFKIAVIALAIYVVYRLLAGKRVFK